jgi:hypothetical protein
LKQKKLFWNGWKLLVRGKQMNKFLLSVEKDEYGFYRAIFSDGSVVDLDTDDYGNAVCAADQLENV